MWTAAAGTVVTRYAVDGWDKGKPVAEMVGNQNWDTWAELDANNHLVVRYVTGDGVNQVFARIDGNGVGWLIQDALNSVRDVVSNSGVVLSHIDYNAFGGIAYQSNSIYSGDMLFTGDLFDNETGLFYSRARYYDPSTARWTTLDPLSFGAGQSNLYQYVSNCPTNATDPSGLWNWRNFFVGVAYAALVTAMVCVAVGTGGAGTPLLIGAIALGGVALSGVAAGSMAQNETEAAWIGIGGGLLTGAAIYLALPFLTVTATASTTLTLIDPNKLNHIFDNPQHNLGPLLNQ